VGRQVGSLANWAAGRQAGRQAGRRAHLAANGSAKVLQLLGAGDGHPQIALSKLGREDVLQLCSVERR
jgi:hypothetical protein